MAEVQQCGWTLWPARELATCRGSAPDEVSDCVEGEAEHVVEHERGPLGGREPVEHQGESELDLVIERDPVGGVDGLLTEDRLDTLP